MPFRGGSSAEHSAEFRDPRFLRQDPDGTDRRFLRSFLFNGEMTVCAGGDLCKMGNAEDLFPGAEFVQFSGNDNRRFSADVGVDLVKYKRSDLIDFRKNGFDREHLSLIHISEPTRPY